MLFISDFDGCLDGSCYIVLPTLNTWSGAKVSYGIGKVYVLFESL